MTLELVHSRHDLPPSWDGVPVEWSEWSTGNTTLALHVPADKPACDQCGAIEEPSISFGKRPPAQATYPSTRVKTTKSGHKYEVAIEVPSWPIRDLIAARCRHCGHDVVTDLRTDQRWDLEPEDYGDTGSNYQPETLF